MLPPHALGPSHVTSVSAAVLVMPPEHAAAWVQVMLHEAPPHVTGPAHADVPAQTILHDVAFAQSTPAAQALVPVQSTLHGIPGGQ